MGKNKTYVRKYKKSWEKETLLKPWLAAIPGNDRHARCKYCNTKLVAHHIDLVNHAKTKQHCDNAKPFSTARTLTDLGVKNIVIDNTVSIIEMKLTVHVAIHSTLRPVDHLGEIVNTLTEKEIAIHQTKCSAFIKNALVPAMLRELVQDLKGTSYSLIVDESTDITMQKQLCVVVRYYNASLKHIVTNFIAMIIIENGTADTIFDAIVNYRQAHNIPIERCIGLATDGCISMVGCNHSLIKNFKQVCPNIVHIKCICHSIQLASSYALLVLPRNIEALVELTYNWFSHSTLRQLDYKAMYAAINVGEELLKIMQKTKTRWLPIASCVERIMQKYDELKEHFRKAAATERCLIAEDLFGKYGDPVIKLYLVFIMPYLRELNRVSKLLQLEKGSPVKLLSELMTLYRTCLSAVMRPVTFTTWSSTLKYNVEDARNQLSLSAIYFGTNTSCWLLSTSPST